MHIWRTLQIKSVVIITDCNCHRAPGVRQLSSALEGEEGEAIFFSVAGARVSMCVQILSSLLMGLIVEDSSLGSKILFTDCHSSIWCYGKLHVNSCYDGSSAIVQRLQSYQNLQVRPLAPSDDLHVTFILSIYSRYTADFRVTPESNTTQID